MKVLSIVVLCLAIGYSHAHSVQSSHTSVTTHSTGGGAFLVPMLSKVETVHNTVNEAIGTGRTNFGKMMTNTKEMTTSGFGAKRGLMNNVYRGLTGGVSAVKRFMGVADGGRSMRSSGKPQGMVGEVLNMFGLTHKTAPKPKPGPRGLLGQFGYATKQSLSAANYIGNSLIDVTQNVVKTGLTGVKYMGNLGYYGAQFINEGKNYIVSTGIKTAKYAMNSGMNVAQGALKGAYYAGGAAMRVGYRAATATYNLGYNAIGTAYNYGYKVIDTAYRLGYKTMGAMYTFGSYVANSALGYAGSAAITGGAQVTMGGGAAGGAGASSTTVVASTRSVRAG